MAPDTIQVKLADNVTLQVKLTNAQYLDALGMGSDQITMLRAVFEDTYGVDPATLTSSEILAKARAKDAPAAA